MLVNKNNCKTVENTKESNNKEQECSDIQNEIQKAANEDRRKTKSNTEGNTSKFGIKK